MKVTNGDVSKIATHFNYATGRYEVKLYINLNTDVNIDHVVIVHLFDTNNAGHVAGYVDGWEQVLNRNISFMTDSEQTEYRQGMLAAIATHAGILATLQGILSATNVTIKH